MATGLGKYRHRSGNVKVANPGQHPRASVLQGRMEDFTRMMAPGAIHEGKVKSRIFSDGFHHPGSNKK